MASSTVKFLIPHCTSRWAAESPAIPAPMMTTEGSGLHGSIMQGSIWQLSNFAIFAHGGVSFDPAPLPPAEAAANHLGYQFLQYFVLLTIFTTFFLSVFFITFIADISIFKYFHIFSTKNSISKLKHFITQSYLRILLLTALDVAWDLARSISYDKKLWTC